MQPEGFLLLALHTHQPFIRHPELVRPFEETWLAGTLTRSYVPLLEVCDGWVRDGIPARLTVSLTPCLIEMLADPYRQAGCVEYLDERIRFLEEGCRRLRDQPLLLRVAALHLQRFRRCRQVYEGDWNRDVLAVLARLQHSGVLRLIPSAATHAYLPLWTLYPEMIGLQIRVGREVHQRRFGNALGFWLPECGFAPGIDQLLSGCGAGYFFVDAHGLTHGAPRPKFDLYAPIITPAGVAVFGRDWRTHDIVWRDSGYPGDPEYLRFQGESASQADAANERGATLGISYFRRGSDGEPYDPEAALARCAVHADDFVQRCRSQSLDARRWLPRTPLIVGSFDTEHLGHWWFEGATWLDLVVRKLACQQDAIRLITAEQYLEIYPENQLVSLSMSSWGYQGYSESWLMGSNHWIYPELFQRAERLRVLAAEPYADPLAERALAEYIRELMQGQTSDWAYIMHAYPEMHYAGARVRRHLAMMDCLDQALQTGGLDAEWLSRIERDNLLFREVDVLGIYRNALHGG
jgi:1,4-alpha-glucan branching enzyme